MDKLSKLEKLNRLLELSQNDTMTPKDVDKFLRFLFTIIKGYKTEFKELSDSNIALIKKTLNHIISQNSNLLTDIDNKNKGVRSDVDKKVKELISYVDKMSKRLPKDGKDADEEKIIKDVLTKLPKQIIETPEELRDKLSSLKGGDRLDASAIKNLPSFNGTNFGGNTARYLSQLNDVVITSIANNDVLKWNSTTLRWENGAAAGGGHTIEDEGTPLTTRASLNFVGAGVAVTDAGGKTVVTINGGGGTIDGSGTLNELTYWVDSDTLGSLAVATYPSLTELAYVKGVTSAIQTQLNGKAPSLGADDNYVTDAQLVVIGNTSGTNTGDNAVNTLYSGLVTNATHTGDATGSGALTVVAINGTNMAALGTGILKNTTGTGVPSIAIAGDFPTLNQSTTGSAATLTNTRTIWGQNFNGSANVTGDITLGVSSITMTGSIATTGARATKVWTTDLESTNMPTVGGTSLSSTFQGLDTQLTSLAALTYAGNGGKYIRLNAGATDFELVTVSGSGDMVLADAQTNSGVKTFLNTTMKLRNVANTFDGYFVNTNTADRIYTLKDAAGTIAFVSDITGTNSGTNTGDQTSIVGITGTKAQFDTAVTDGNIMYDGDSITNATSTAWRVFYGDGSGVITELALGASGTYLKSNGAASAPTFDTPAGGSADYKYYIAVGGYI